MPLPSLADLWMMAFGKAHDLPLLSAISRSWRLHLNFPCQVESNGWFSAINLIARISGVGQQAALGRFI